MRRFTCCPIDVRAGSAYFERVRRRGLIEGGALCQRYRFADPRTALLAEALLGFPTRLEEYSVPVALYDLGYNLGIARRLLPEADIGHAIAAYEDVAERWNAIRFSSCAPPLPPPPAARARTSGPSSTPKRARAAPRRRAAGRVADALASVERTASRAHGEPVRSHARGRLLSAVALSMALAACDRPLTPTDGGTAGPGRGSIVHRRRRRPGRLHHQHRRGRQHRRGLDVPGRRVGRERLAAGRPLAHAAPGA